MTTYIYQPLDHRKAQTRLVTIPTLGDLDESAPLQVSIHTVTIPRRYLTTSLESALEEADLNHEDSDIEKPAFVALSYVWGSPDDPSEVFVESAPEGANKISITRNLDVALRHMRSKIQQPVVFWIDAICIDQGNLQERSYQVAFMDSIYTIAAGTFVWLGLEENNSDLAMDILLYVGERVCEVAEGTFERAPDAPPREREEPIWESRDQEIPFGEDDMHAVVSLLERPWFTRVWIQQEIALAAKAQIQCGKSFLDWDYFKVAVKCLMVKLPSRSLTEGLRRRLLQIRGRIIHLCVAAPFRYRYEQMRWENRGLGSTDPRDKIYAIRSLLTRQDKSLGVQPDYTLATADVFMDVCVRIVDRQRGIYFLKICELSSISVPNLPSWVPDWSTPMKADMDGPNTWSACGFISSNAAYLGDKILRVSGLHIDNITTIQDLYDHPCDKNWCDSSVLIKHIWSCRPGPDRIHTPYDQKQSMLEAYCRTFHRDFLLDFRRFKDAGRMRIPWLSLDEAKEALDKIWSMNEESTRLDDLMNDPLVRRFIHGSSCSYETCFFITKDGYIGMAPRGIQIGDIVSVILGCDTPLILRKECSSTAEPDETRWKVVGASYTAGLMSGEAIYGSLPVHYQSVYFEKPPDDEQRICRLGYAFVDTRTDEVKTDPAAILEEFGITPSVWTREPHRLEVSESVLRDVGVKLRDFLLV